MFKIEDFVVIEMGPVILWPLEADYM